MIKLASPDIRNSDIDRCIEVIQSGNLVQGKNVQLLEHNICSFSNIQNCAVVSSGTAALHLTLKALGISCNDKIIVPTFTFPATANAVENMGADIIFCDVNKNTYVIEEERLEKCIIKYNTSALKGVIIVHEFGYPANIKKIRKICDKYGLILVEDAACALGTIANNHHVGHYSHAACLSFHPRKAITTGEGGAVICNDENLIFEVKKLRNHGIELHKNRINFTASGLNYRMTDFQAALAIGQIERFPQEIAAREKLAQRYIHNLSKTIDVQVPLFHQGHSWQSYMIVLSKKISRNKIIDSMKNSGVETNLGAQALHTLDYFKYKYSHSPEDFPNALYLYQQGLTLPIYGKLSSKDIDLISQNLIEAIIH